MTQQQKKQSMVYSILDGTYTIITTGSNNNNNNNNNNTNDHVKSQGNPDLARATRWHRQSTHGQ